MLLLYTCSYLEFLQNLEERVDKNWPEISSSLEEIRKSLISKNGCLINLTADGKNLVKSEKLVSKFLDMLPNSSPVGSAAWSARLPPTNEAIVVPTQVSKHIFSLSFHFCELLSWSISLMDF